MNQKIRNIAVAVASAAFIIIVAAHTYSTPKNAHECILDNIENAKTDAAAKVIFNSCKNLYGNHG